RSAATPARERVERPAVPRVALEIAAVDLLGVGGTARLEQHGTERLTRREVPRGRFHVGNLVLLLHGSAQHLRGGGDLAGRCRVLSQKMRVTDLEQLRRRSDPAREDQLL